MKRISYFVLGAMVPASLALATGSVSCKLELADQSYDINFPTSRMFGSPIIGPVQFSAGRNHVSIPKEQVVNYWNSTDAQGVELKLLALDENFNHPLLRIDAVEGSVCAPELEFATCYRARDVLIDIPGVQVAGSDGKLSCNFE